jgi:hypothetical protein
MVIDHKRLMQVCNQPASTAIMGLDSTDDGFCQQEDRGRWMVAGVMDMRKRDGVVITVACEGIARFLQPR